MKDGKTKDSKTKDYAILSLIFIVFYVSIDTASRGVAPPTFSYFLIAVIFIAGLLAYRRHSLPYIKTMYAVSMAVQFIFMLAVPYWVLHVGNGLNSGWPLYPEMLWTTGYLAFWYYLVSFGLAPVAVFLYGRRAWCSFTCGMGAVAETLGDKYRTQGAKGSGVPAGFVALKWFILIATVGLTAAALAGKSKEKAFFLIFLIFFILLLRTLIMTAVNIILMPKFGTRIWCKYFCPQGLLLGLISRLGKFALVKDQSLCAGCGTCNANCSMSIDVKGGPAVNRSGDCVGCGVCVEVCPQKALAMTTDRSLVREKAGAGEIVSN